MTQHIKAPYNFVPVSTKVFFPEWANQISQDIPFHDSESGELELTITAHSPIFVRNGHTKRDAEEKNDRYKSFSQVDQNEFFIPATSIKGAIRNVLEIMSFGKMDMISNDRYSIRDLDNKKDYLEKMSRINCGWLIKTGDLIKVSDRDIPYYISHQELDNHFNSNLVTLFKEQANLLNPSNRLAIFKYKLFNNQSLDIHFRKLTNENGKTKVGIVAGDGEIGKIVFTGQFGVRKSVYNTKQNKYSWTGKFYEFVFRNNEIGRLSINENDDVWKEFKFIYQDSEDWHYWEEKLNRGEQIPVFFKVNGKKIESLGLSYLYKLPYEKKIKDCLPDGQKERGYDLADCIFGTTGDSSIKGRVQFGHAFLCKEINKADSNKTVLNPLMGSPKASYFPIYLQQEGLNGIVKNITYHTYSSPSAFLKGWKRYPVHNSVASFPVYTQSQQKNTSPFIPINSPAEFCMKVRYHNLKPIELGALIYAITLNDTSAFHNLGFCKPYGYGLVKFTLKNSTCYKDAINEFTNAMNNFIPNWQNSPQIKELLLMARKHTKLDDSHLTYMQLNEFALAKKRDNPPTFLEYYTGENYPLPKTKDTKATAILSPSEYITISSKIVEPKEGWIKATVNELKAKKVLIEGYELPIQLVIPMEKKNHSIKDGNQIWVTIKQKSKDGRINQVQFESIA